MMNIVVKGGGRGGEGKEEKGDLQIYVYSRLATTSHQKEGCAG